MTNQQQRDEQTQQEQENIVRGKEQENQPLEHASNEELDEENEDEETLYDAGSGSDGGSAGDGGAA
jgi:hypothetical protein